MYSRSEFAFKSHDETELFYQLWNPPNYKGTLVITHGQAEHSECYQRLALALKDQSYRIFAWDMRGHGRSEGLRGYAADFQNYADDFRSFLEHLASDLKVDVSEAILLGHSMGGLVQLKALLENPQISPKAQVLSNPLLGISVEVPLIKDLAALAIYKIFPQITLYNEIKFTDLSRDPAVLEEYSMDVLRHDRISAAVYLGSLISMKQINQRASEIKIPTLLQISQTDPVVDSEQARKFFSEISTTNKSLHQYPERRHEIYNDLGREEVFSDLKAFLDSL